MATRKDTLSDALRNYELTLLCRNHSLTHDRWIGCNIAPEDFNYNAPAIAGLNNL